MIYQRLFTSLVGIPILFAAIWLGPFWFFSILSVCAAIAIVEFQRMTSKGTRRVPWFLGIFWTISFLIVGQYSVGLTQFLIISLVTFIIGMFLTALWVIIFCDRSTIYPTWLMTSLGPIYVGFCLSHALALRHLWADDSLGRNWILFCIILIFASDTGGYLVGRLMGKHPFAPILSPSKTWEGTIAGFILVIIAAIFLNGILLSGIIYWQVLLISATVGITAPIGDLFESKLKRIYGLKDTGAILPGHGGMLDRLDSTLLTIPFVYYFAFTIVHY